MGIKFNIFNTIDELGENGFVKEIIAKLKFKCEERRLYDILDQLCIDKFLTRDGIKENARYRLAEYTQKYFLKNSPENYILLFSSLEKFMKKFLLLENELPYGKTHLFTDEIFYSEECTKTFLDCFQRSNRFNFETLVSKIDFTPFKRIVDLHGCAGELSMLIKKECLNSEIISFDNKYFKEFLELKLKGHDMFHAIKAEYGDILKDKIPQGDCYIATDLLFHYSCENKKQILKNIHQYLLPEGMLLIIEHLIDEERKIDDCGLKKSFMMGVLGEEGSAHSFGEYEECLKFWGFKDIKLLKLGKGLSEVIVATKNQSI